MRRAPSTLEAARNNAEWCDLFSRSHGVVGRFDPDAWVSATRTPPLYPDAVTLGPGCAAEALLTRVDARPGCSIKDSFADLDLAPFGFDVLFAAEWLRLERAVAAPAGWSVVADEPALAEWEEGWGETPVPKPFFRPELLADPRVAVLRGPSGGAIAHHAAATLGLGNLFGADPGEAAGAAQAVLGELPVVTYASGAAHDAACAAGFTPCGGLAVWARRG